LDLKLGPRCAPGLSDEDGPGVAQDGRIGEWTKLELERMDRCFCAAVRREHPGMFNPAISSPEDLPKCRRRA
jgi:hypothetical protein